MMLYLTRTRLGDTMDTVMSQRVAAIIHLINTGKIMKIRWNACYAAGIMLEKTDINQDYTLHMDQCSLCSGVYSF